MKKTKNVDEYIADLLDIQAKAISEIRFVVKEIVPEVEESISYGMPAYKLNGKRLVYFAAFAHHIGFYPLPSGIESFKKEFAKYKQGKGSVQFPLDKPMPIELIKKIIRAKVQETKEKNENNL